MPGSTRRLGVLGCLLLAVGVPAFAALPEHVELETIGIVTVPAGATAGGVLIRDLSGLAYDRATDRFLAVNDTNGSGQARIFELNLAYTANAVAGITPLGTAQLRLPNGGLLPSVDAEGLALSQRGRLFVSTEGLGSASLADSRDPWVWEFDRATLRRTTALPVPSHFLPRDDAGNAVAPGAGAQASGVRQNLGFEALTLSPGENYLFLAN
jgi:3-phytase